MCGVVVEKLASMDKKLEDTGINEIVCPFAFAKQGCIPVLLSHDVDFCLRMCGWISSPPTPKLLEENRRFSI